MNAKLSIEITALPDGEHQANVEISASDEDLITVSAPIVDAHITTEAVIDVGAILRMQGGGEGDAADR